MMKLTASQASQARANLIQAIQDLTTAQDVAILRQVLDHYPGLLHADFEAFLTRRIQEAWGQRDQARTCIFLACRTFLTRCRRGGVETGLAAGVRLPLAKASPLSQLLLSSKQKLEPATHAQLARQALDEVRPSTEPDLWAVLQRELADGLFLDKSPAQLRDRWEEALIHYQVALEIWRQLADYERLSPAWQAWAEVVRELAIAYSEASDGDRSQNLERALELLEVVLAEDAPAEDRLQRSRSWIAKGNVYVMRLQGGRTENLERAIQCYHEALSRLSRQVHAADWAKTHYNLAVAYRSRPKDERADNLKQAIEHYRQALEVYTVSTHPVEWAHVQTGLGNTYCQPELGESAANLEQAIECYQAALAVRTRGRDPSGWATVQNNLGNAYADRLRGDPKDNQEQSIACYQLALQERTHEVAPARWAETMNNLGTVYSERLKGNPLGNAQEAIRCLRAALEVHTPQTFSNDSRRAARNLAHLLFSQARWAEAEAAYATAIEANEWLYQASAIELGRQAELAEAKELFTNRAYALARLGKLKEAVECLEAGRTRAMGEALALDTANLAAAAPKDQKSFREVRERLKTLEAETRAIDQTESSDLLTISGELQKTRAELNAIVTHIRATLPDFMPAQMNFTEIGAVVQRLGQPVIYLLTTLVGSLALVIHPSAKITTVWLPTFKSLDLSQLLSTPDDSNSYLYGVTKDSSTLQQTLDPIIASLRTRLMDQIAIQLRQARYTQAVLIPSGPLSLLPLHAAVQTELSLAFIPSARVLKAALAAASYRATLSPRLVGIGNPANDQEPLVYAQLEVERIAVHFPPERRRTLFQAQATRATVLNHFPGATYLHFACHGHFNMAQPLDAHLLLAGEDMLTLRELLNGTSAGKPDLSTVRLVILSACQTGLTEFQRIPDETLGFPAGFLQAGVPGIISTLWPVDDSVTAILLERFYAFHFVEKLDPAQALHRAQTWLSQATPEDLALYYEKVYKQSGETDEDALEWKEHYANQPVQKPFAHPFYWAAFTFSGVGTGPA